MRVRKLCIVFMMFLLLPLGYVHAETDTVKNNNDSGLGSGSVVASIELDDTSQISAIQSSAKSTCEKNAKDKGQSLNKDFVYMVSGSTSRVTCDMDVCVSLILSMHTCLFPFVISQLQRFEY